MTTTAITIFTIGHSNMAMTDLIALLRQNGVDALIDIRAWPHSRHHPQFDQDSLRVELEQTGLIYHWAGRQLGGMRKPRADSLHLALEGGMRGYADHTQTDTFKTGVARLKQLASDKPTCLMCAEREPMECHRSLLSDYLLLQGVDVQHINGVGHKSAHHLRPEARRESGQLIYDRLQQHCLPL